MLEKELETERRDENGEKDDENETSVGRKRVAAASEDSEMANDTKKPKLVETNAIDSPQIQEEDGGKSMLSSDDTEAHDKADTAM